jgi:hypothetical protein
MCGGTLRSLVEKNKMIPSRKEIVLAVLDDLLGEQFNRNKLADLREIEQTAKRMADGIERRQKTEA